MLDAYSDHQTGLTSPAVHAETIVPSDTFNLARTTRAVYVGQTGDVRAITSAGDMVTFSNMQGGSVYPIRVQRILQTGTTATGLVGLS